MKKKEFLDKSRNIHGYKYTYINLCENITNNHYIDIMYNDIVYRQKVVKHLMGRCPEKNTIKKTTQDFITESRKIWGDKYDYSLVKYDGAHKKVSILFDGIIFKQTPSSHISGAAPELKMNKDFFIKKSIDIWGDKYDYSLVEYKNCKDKVKIILKETNKIFEQSPEMHLLYSPEKKSIKKTTDMFISDAYKIHGDKYNYDNVNYINSSTKICIKCYEHGYFYQTPNSHLYGCGCKKCGDKYNNREYNFKYNTESFIYESKLIWGDKYDYSLTEYKNGRTKVKIIYDDIIYEQMPGLHLKHPSEFTYTHDIYLKKAIRKWDNKYDYSKTKFISTHEPIIVIYNGVEYSQLPNNHLKYAPELRNIKTVDEFIEDSKEIHYDKYDYSLVNYINMNTKVKIGCPSHGYFYQKPSIHLNGSGCRKCSESKGEKKIDNYLKEIKVDYNREYVFMDCRNKLPLRFDFYIPSLNTCIEFDGIQHFQPVEHFGGLESYEQLKKNDKIKNDYCEDNYINIIRIKYDQLDRINEILDNNLRTLINIKRNSF